MLKDRQIPKFSLITACLVLLSFFGYWLYRFGVFSPVRGTSTASISALWGQFTVSTLAALVLCGIVLVADLRSKAVPIFKLLSFYVLTILVIGSLSFAVKRNIDSRKISDEFGTTHTYTQSQEFNYLQYSFTVSWKTEDIRPQDCSAINYTPVSGVIRLYSDKSQCESRNNVVSGQKVATVLVTVKNNNNSFSHFTPEWLTILSGTGNKYELWESFTNFNDGTYAYEIKPNGELSGELNASANLKKGENIYEVILKIDNHAEQIIK